jgi:transcriptional regulator with XRE-family HTH domain
LEPEFQALRQLILLRKKLKITQQKLAEKINMRQSHIARLETGEVTPTLKVLKKYANGLNQVISFNIISLGACPRIRI